MKKTDDMKDVILARKLKAEDRLELPMDENFFDNLHNQIMLSVEKTEVKPVNKFEKTWVFLERKTQGARARIKKVAKPSMVAVILVAGLSLLNTKMLQEQSVPAAKNSNQSVILQEAKESPADWSELVSNYQSETDFYADVLSRKDLETIVEIDNAFAQSL